MPPPILGQRRYKRLRGELNDALASAMEWTGAMLREIQSQQDRGKRDFSEILTIHTEIMASINRASQMNLELLRHFAAQEDQAEEQEEAVGAQLDELRTEIERLWSAIDRRADNENIIGAGEYSPSPGAPA